MVFPFLALPARALERLKTKLDGAPAVDHSLMQEVLRLACPDLDERLDADNCRSIRAFVRDAAWTDATLALIAYALPHWRLRRIAEDDGQWWCALDRRQPAYWTDPEVDEHHEDMDLALLKSFITALCRELEEPSAVPVNVSGGADLTSQSSNS